MDEWSSAWYGSSGPNFLKLSSRYNFAKQELSGVPVAAM